MIGAVFHSSNKRSQHQIDWLGAIYLSMALLCIILFTPRKGAASMRGMTRSCGAFWPFGIVGDHRHLFNEERMAAEPIIPLALFRNRSFLLVQP